MAPTIIASSPSSRPTFVASAYASTRSLSASLCSFTAFASAERSTSVYLPPWTSFWISIAETPLPTSPPSPPKSPEGASAPVSGLSKFKTAMRFFGVFSCPRTQKQTNIRHAAAAICTKKRKLNFPGLCFRQIACEHICASFHKFALRFGERVREIALNVQFARQLFVHRDRHHDFRLHHRGPRQVTRIFAHILHDHRLFAGGCRAAQPGVQRDAHAGREASRVGPDNQKARVDGINNIKADPVVTRELLMQPLGDVRHEGFRLGGAPRMALQLFQNFVLRRCHAPAPRLRQLAGAEACSVCVQFTRRARTRMCRIRLHFISDTLRKSCHADAKRIQTARFSLGCISLAQR